MKTTPYLFFDGNCGDAISFYRDILGAEVRALVRAGDLPGAGAQSPTHVMHAELAIGDSLLFLSDGSGERSAPAGRFAVSLQASSDTEAEKLFENLAEEGTISVPLMSTPFASRFGMATDRFGIPWMVTHPSGASS